MTEHVGFDRVARVPAAGDNVAIATRRLDAGTEVADGEGTYRLPHTVLEGHRFVREPIAEGARLLSWGLPFGVAVRPLAPGEYVCNAKILEALAERDIDFALPRKANFTDTIETFDLDETTFRPGEQVARVDSDRMFEGYRRGGGRGVGTRNFVVVLAVTSRANGFARHAAEQAARRAPPGVDGVVAVTHTEGGGGPRPNNLDYVLRVLAGFMVHPNVGAVLAVDDGAGSYTSADLKRFMSARGYPLDHVVHAFLRIDGGYETEVARAVALIDGWLPEAAGAVRTPGAGRGASPRAPVRGVRRVLRRLRERPRGLGRQGGYPPRRVRQPRRDRRAHRGGALRARERARRRDRPPLPRQGRELQAVCREPRRHRRGQSVGGQQLPRALQHRPQVARGGPQEGPRGPARLRDRLRAAHAPARLLLHGQPRERLESIAGQVASGSNLILFITGNGSITNFRSSRP